MPWLCPSAGVKPECDATKRVASLFVERALAALKVVDVDRVGQVRVVSVKSGLRAGEE